MTTYWAELDTNNIVKQVITGVDDLTIEGVPTGDWYTNFVGAPCVQTFINDPNKTYAGIGYTYNADLNIFVAPQPYGSWSLDDNYVWQPPTPYPNDNKIYAWFEPNKQWIEIIDND